MIANRLKHLSERILTARKVKKKPPILEDTKGLSLPLHTTHSLLNSIHPLCLLAVSKTHSASAIQAAFDCGIIHFGENSVQEAIKKQHSLSSLSIIWHFIGRIQSRETQKIARHFDWVQSVDRAKILIRLNEQRLDEQQPLNICLQVNFFNEPQKQGVEPKSLFELFTLIQDLPKLKLQGLMFLPPKQNTFTQQHHQFKQIAAFFKDCQSTYPQLQTLSMGMSHDLEAAISAGTTMIRIGTDLFGKRENLI
jgi:pyridoxal phosphate enzyme (YggS family)